MPASLPEHPWAESVQSLEQAMGLRGGEGLTQAEHRERLATYGPNSRGEFKPESVWAILFRQFKSLIVLLLAVAAGVSWLLGDAAETVAIGLVVLLNVLIGFWTELKGRRSMEALLRMGQVTCRVKREGGIRTIDAEELVPGDLVLLEGGDIVPADMRLVEASRVQANESALTGESLPVDKALEPVPAATALPDRVNMLFQGTFVLRGSAAARVTGTGLRTELGRITDLVHSAQEERTPLEERLRALGARLIVLTLVVAALVGALGVVTGKEMLKMVETSIALAVAAIPEGLPVVATIALANGMRRMVAHNAVMTRLSSVETLGATGVICTDKTGTLTENRMDVTRLVLSAEGEDVPVPSSDREQEEEPERTQDRMENRTQDLEIPEPFVRVLALCNNAALEHGSSAASGDPLEIALLRAVGALGGDVSAIRESCPRVEEEAFDSETKMMATWNRMPDGDVAVLVKGAPSIVLDHSVSVGTAEEALSAETRAAWEARISELASEGARLIGLACRREADPADPPYRELVFLGVAALSDPPRQDVRGAIASCASAGIKVVMLTGDQPETAEYVAREVGLIPEDEPLGGHSIHGKELEELDEIESVPARVEAVFDTPVFARITPRQKLDLIGFYQNRGHVVAMTGDGVNDAPALKKADIGISMGRRGTQVAMDASDMILRDDAFSTIVHAVRHGRIIFRNIRSFIFFLMSCNVSEVFVVAAGTVAGFGLTPLQILFLNLVTDVFPALALGVSRGGPGIMQEKPRPASEQILEKSHWALIVAYGLWIAAISGLAAWISVGWLGADSSSVVTILFYTLAFAQVWHVLNMRSAGSGLFTSEVARNGWVWGAVALCTVLLTGILAFGLTRGILDLVLPPPAVWGAVLACSLLVLPAGSLLLRWSRSR